MSYTNFRTNLDPASLIGNLPIQIDFGDEDFLVIFNPPSMKEYYYDMNFFEFIALLKVTPEDYSRSKDARTFIVETRYDTFSAVLKHGFKKEKVISYFNKYFTNITIKDEMLFVGEREIAPKEFDFLVDIFLIACGEKELESLEMKELTPQERDLKEKEQKIKEIRSKNKKGKPVPIDQIIIALLFEFPALTLSDIFNMNVFTFLYFWEMVPEVATERIASNAAAFGNAKDYSHFTNRGDKI